MATERMTRATTARRGRIAMLTLAGLALPVLGTGCVQQDNYDELLTANRSLQQQLVQKEERIESLEGSEDVLRDQLGSTEGSLRRLQQENARLRSGLDEASASAQALEDRVRDISLGPLPTTVSSQLDALVAQHPGMLSFDAASGKLQFASDLTFDLGSAELTPQARQSVERLARILSRGEGAGLEIEIVGHTDNVKVSRPETRANHPTNEHLSVHRAIAVQRAMRESGIDPVRMKFAGYGEYRPLVENPASGGGARQNRRVEIFLRPMPPLSVRPAASQPPAAAPTRPSGASRAADPIGPTK